MTPEEALTSHQVLISENGQPIKLRRYAGNGAARAVSIERNTSAFVRTYGKSEIQGSVIQGDQSMIILVDTLTDMLPLTTNDFAVVEGIEYSIKNPIKRVVGGVLVAYELHTEG